MRFDGLLSGDCKKIAISFTWGFCELYDSVVHTVHKADSSFFVVYLSVTLARGVSELLFIAANLMMRPLI